MEQKIITAGDSYIGIERWAEEAGARKILLVCGASIRFLRALEERLGRMERGGVSIIRFTDFQPNPRYESVIKGVELYRREQCDAVMAVGGGSAMDVAKCIRAFSSMEPGSDWLGQPLPPNGVPFLAMPTTAGSGSEATRYAVIYRRGVKQSVTGDGCLPGTVLLAPDCLRPLPLYQRKATMMDALCHAVESSWSVNSTDESREYARTAIAGVMAHMEGYLANTDEGNAGMMMAAHEAGRAINITQTTAGHAMCYRITGLFGCAHGHAAALCDRVLFPWMLENIGKCTDPRGEAHLESALLGIAESMGCATAGEGAARLQEVFGRLELEVPEATAAQFEALKASVNPERLKNHPVALDMEDLDEIYHEILREACDIES